MSVSEKHYGKIEEDQLDRTYEEIVLERVEDDGPVSAQQIKQELKNEHRYDSHTDPEDVELVDDEKVDEIFQDLRDRNRSAELDQDLAVSIDGSRIYLRTFSEQESLYFEDDNLKENYGAVSTT